LSMPILPLRKTRGDPYADGSLLLTPGGDFFVLTLYWESYLGPSNGHLLDPVFSWPPLTLLFAAARPRILASPRLPPFSIWRFSVSPPMFCDLACLCDRGPPLPSNRTVPAAAHPLLSFFFGFHGSSCKESFFSHFFVVHWLPPFAGDFRRQ